MTHTFRLLVLSFAVIASLASSPAKSDDFVNINACVTSQHFRSGKDESNPGIGLEYLRTFPTYSWNHLTPYVAGGVAYCDDSYFQHDAAGRQYDANIPDRWYLTADLGVETWISRFKVGLALRIGAADYRKVHHLMNLPHVGEFAIGPALNLRLATDAKSWGLDGTMVSCLLDHIYTDITPAINPENMRGGFVAIKVGWSIPLQ